MGRSLGQPAFSQPCALDASPEDDGHDYIVVPASEDRLRQAGRRGAQTRFTNYPQPVPFKQPGQYRIETVRGSLGIRLGRDGPPADLQPNVSGQQAKENSHRKRHAPLEALSALPQPFMVPVTPPDERGRRIAEPHADNSRNHAQIASWHFPASSVASTGSREGRKAKPQRDGAANEEKYVRDDHRSTVVPTICVGMEKVGDRFG